MVPEKQTLDTLRPSLLAISNPLALAHSTNNVVKEKSRILGPTPQPPLSETNHTSNIVDSHFPEPASLSTAPRVRLPVSHCLIYSRFYHLVLLFCLFHEGQEARYERRSIALEPRRGYLNNTFD